MGADEICGAPRVQARAEILCTKPVCKEPGRYCGWPTVCRAKNGDLLVVFSGDRDEHLCPWGKVQMVRSSDGGKTWGAPAKRVPFASKWGRRAPYEKMSKEAWCGDAVYHPFNFRGWFEYGAGALGDMGCHRANTIYRALGLKWPQRVEASSSRVSEVAFPLTSIVTYDYATCRYGHPVRLTWYDGGLLPPTPRIAGSYTLPSEGVIYFGTKGCVLFDAYKPLDCKLVFFDPDLEAKAKALPKTLPRRPGWIYGEWLQACKGGEAASCNFDFAQYITEFVQIGNLAVQTQKPVEFDPAAMKVTNGNDAADRLLHSAYENGYALLRQ